MAATKADAGKAFDLFVATYYYSAESVLVPAAESGRLGASRRTGC
jgi:hypothetical protein